MRINTYARNILKLFIPSIIRNWIRKSAIFNKPISYMDRYGPQNKTNHPHYKVYRKKLLKGHVPEKYTRLLPLVDGNKILEIGAGEGILSLYLSRFKKRVISLDITPARQKSGRELQQAWITIGITGVEKCEFVQGDIFNNIHLLRDVDTIIASRVIYYFQDRLDELFSEISKEVETVVLIGNEKRNRKWNSNRDGGKIGKYAYYSTLEGMKDILTRHGYNITTTLETDDPVVVGKK